MLIERVEVAQIVEKAEVVGGYGYPDGTEVGDTAVFAGMRSPHRRGRERMIPSAKPVTRRTTNRRHHPRS